MGVVIVTSGQLGNSLIKPSDIHVLAVNCVAESGKELEVDRPLSDLIKSSADDEVLLFPSTRCPSRHNEIRGAR